MGGLICAKMLRMLGNWLVLAAAHLLDFPSNSEIK